jgi:hypothetical protein
MRGGEPQNAPRERTIHGSKEEHFLRSTHGLNDLRQIMGKVPRKNDENERFIWTLLRIFP